MRFGDALTEVTAPPAAAWVALSDRYRAGGGTDPALTPDGAAAYAMARAPATHAATAHALAQLARQRPDLAPTSVLDVGAGPGTAAWAALEAFPSITTATFVERAPAMVALGRRLAATHPVLAGATWQGEVGAARADLVVASYVVSEVGPAIVPTLWAAATGELVIVDTGTPAGFAAVLAARTALLAAGATVTAPCPNDGPCPSDWCHVATRVQRSTEHRRLKGGDLGHEDEPFSYIAASRAEPAHATARIVRRPKIHSGHVRLEVCAGGAVTPVVVTRSAGARYKVARKAAWGDPAP